MEKAATLTSILDNAVENYSYRVAVKSQITGESWTYEQLRNRAFGVSGALARRGVEKRDRVAIISDNTPAFVAGDYGILYTGATSVPIDQNLKPDNLLKGYLDLTKPRLILAEEKYINNVKKHTNLSIISLEESLRESPFRPDVNMKEEEVSTIIFSSGTSSESEYSFKAVQLSHSNIASNVFASEELASLAERSGGFSQGIYLSGIARQWHSFEYMLQKALMNKGCLLHFTDVSRFMKGKAAEINPHYVIMIPKVADLIMNQTKEKIREKGLIKNMLFEAFLRNSNNFNFHSINNNYLNRLREEIHSLADKLFYKKIRENLRRILGRNNLYPIGGSAPLHLETQLFFYSIGMPIYQGYGLTETSPAISVNFPWAYRFGSSGMPLKGIEILIADTSFFEKERKIKRLNEGKEGLILIKGRNVFVGYLGDEKETRESFVEGWLNTGDLGYMEKGFLFVNGRNKDLICKSNGEKTNPSPIESYYGAKGIDLVLVGNNQEKDGAFIIADEKIKESLKRGLSEQEIIDELCKIRLYDSRKKFGIQFSRRNLAILSDMERFPELITNTKKVRRKLVEKHYSSLVEKICN